jgi:hypothetical protein
MNGRRTTSNSNYPRDISDFDALAFDLDFLLQVLFDRVADLDASEVFADTAGLLAKVEGPAVGESSAVLA